MLNFLVPSGSGSPVELLYSCGGYGAVTVVQMDFCSVKPPFPSMGKRSGLILSGRPG